jgi:MYXO-CTERM domain-containing protein
MQRWLKKVLSTGGVAAMAATTLLAPDPAYACGGFFCDNAQPVNQAAERIIFSYETDGSVTAVIQIQYAGEADRFAWVLPVAGRPEVRVASNAAFQRLQGATNPQYVLNTRVEGTCRAEDFRGFLDASAPSWDGGFAPSDSGVPPVTVVDQGNVGPYDYVIISVDPSLMRHSDVAVQWLRDNGYQIEELGADRLQPYLAGGMNLLAFRLTKGNDTGSIRPVSISFGPGVASIPIRPTAVAAVADMGVMVWVLGASRAVPSNYMSLEINDALINWFNPNLNYNDVVTEAANQAGGQGFVTEMAGAAAPLADVVYFPGERDNWAWRREQGWAGREGELLVGSVWQYGRLDGLREALAATLPVPEGATLDEVLACVSCFFSIDAPDIAGFEPEAFLAAIYSNVIEPMERVRAMFERNAYLTRLYTTMSANEMDRDPTFELNPDLGDVPTLHTAERVIECSPSITQGEAPWRVELPSGQVVRGTGGTWPFSVTDGRMPANARISRVGTSGSGEVVQDNVAAIQSTLRDHNATVPPPPPVVSEGGGGCAVSPGAQGGLAGIALAILSLGFVVARRRRR